MTLWESAPLGKCDTCGGEYKIWDLGAAHDLGEPTQEGEWPDYSKRRHINPEFKGYEKTCSFCRHEDIEFKYKEYQENLLRL